MIEDRIPLADVPEWYLKAHGRHVSYSMCWRLAREGYVATSRRGTRLFIATSDLPRLAALFEKRRAAIAAA